MTAKILFPLVIAGMLSLAAMAGAAAPAAEEADAGMIMQRAFEVYSGDDSFSRLHFSFEYDRGKTGTLSLLMAYKRYPVPSGLESRVIMFNEYPPDKKDIGFLGWFYRPEQGKDEDLWLYLPELRQTRKLTRKHQDRDVASTGMKRRPEGDEFSVSELDREELVPRDPRFDRHTLIGTEILGGRLVYKVDSMPRDADSSSYAKFVAWIAQDEFLPQRIDYYDRHMTLVKTVTFSWKKFGTAWVWDKVTAVNQINGNKTVLEQTDTRVNLGLPDEMFTKRMLDQGSDTFAHRVAPYIK